MRLAYCEIVKEAQLVVAQQEHGGDLVAGMLQDEFKRVNYAFRAPSNKAARAWLWAFRWLAEGTERYIPPQLAIPAPELVKSEMERAGHDIALIDLPFERVNQLLRGLYDRRVMGKRKPTLRRMVYNVFQLELHAWSIPVEVQHKKRTKRKPHVSGCYLEELRGLHFHLVLERLTLLHYGKCKCLSYADQVTEYNTEINHIALQRLQCCVSWWLFRRRVGRTVGGHAWPAHPVWSKCPLAFAQASEGVCATRMRSLTILLGEVERKSRPVHMDKPPPPKKPADLGSRSPRANSGSSRSGWCRKKKADGDDDAELAGAGKRSHRGTQAEVDALSGLSAEDISAAFADFDSGGNSSDQPEGASTAGDGILSREEIWSAMQRLTGTTLSDATFDVLIRELDTNRNGVIERDEFASRLQRFAKQLADGSLDAVDGVDSDLEDLEESAEERMKRLAKQFDD